MIFAFVEGGRVDVLESAAAARSQWPPTDVEGEVVFFYSEDGIWLKPHFTKPNRYRLFGLIWQQGDYELLPSSVLDPGADPFDLALSEAVVLTPNPHFASLEAIRAHVASKGGAEGT